MAIQTEGQISIDDILAEFQMTGQQFNLSDFYAGAGKIPAGTKRSATVSQSTTDGLAQDQDVPSSGQIGLANFYGIRAIAPILNVPISYSHTTGPKVAGSIDIATSFHVNDDGELIVEDIANNATVLRSKKIGSYINGFYIKISRAAGMNNVQAFIRGASDDVEFDIYDLPRNQRVYFGSHSSPGFGYTALFTVQGRQRDFLTNGFLLNVSIGGHSQFVSNGANWSAARIDPFVGNDIGATHSRQAGEYMLCQIGISGTDVYLRTRTPLYDSYLFDNILLATSLSGSNPEVQLSFIDTVGDNINLFERWPASKSNPEFGWTPISQFWSNQRTSLEFGSRLKGEAWGGTRWNIKIRDGQSHQIIHDQVIRVTGRRK